MSEAVAAAGFSRWFSDERLTRRAVDGDQRAFAAIFRRYHQDLFRYCLAIVGNPEDAQEALQNTMVKVLRALPGEKRKVELKPWLYRIAHNEAIDLVRKRREAAQIDVEQIAPGYGLAEDAETRERLRRLFADLRELPERQREVLVMRELAGLSFEEIGTALETSPAAVRQTLYEARQSLRQMEEGREMTCAEVAKALSDGDGRVIRRRDVRAHIRSCADCRGFRDEIEARERDLAALAPLPAVAAAAMLQGLLGGSQAATGGGLAAALGGGAAKTIGLSAAAKGAATVAVVAAVGVTAADRSGVVHLGLPGDGNGAPAKSAPAVPGAAPAGDPGGAVTPGGAPGGQSEASGDRGEQNQQLNQSNPNAVPGANSGAAQTKPDPHERGQGHANGQSPEKTTGPPEEHPSGKGHEKQHPDAAAGGQENAAENKQGGNAYGKNPGSKPAKEPKPAKEKAPKEPKAPKEGKPPPEEAPANPPPAASEPSGQASLPPQSHGNGKAKGREGDLG